VDLININETEQLLSRWIVKIDYRIDYRISESAATAPRAIFRIIFETAPARIFQENIGNVRKNAPPLIILLFFLPAAFAL
jgi:hypothetical protein